MNVTEHTYILYIRKTGEIIITPDGPVIAEILGVSKHTVLSWFREGRVHVDKYEKKGFILCKGSRSVKSQRGKNNFKKKKYNW